MSELNDDIAYEAVELSDAVFSRGREVFNEDYDGLVENYFVIEDLRNSIEAAMMDKGGEIPYMDELPSFSDLGYKETSWVKVFDYLDPESSYGDLADISEFTEGHIPNVVSKLEDEEMVNSVEKQFSRDVFYGEKAFPYLRIISEAKRLVEGGLEGSGDSAQVSEDSGNVQQSNDSDTGPVSENQEEEKDLHDIMRDVAEDEDDFRTMYKQKDDGGVNSRDHTDSDPDESSNPNDDEYYEGW